MFLLCFLPQGLGVGVERTAGTEMRSSPKENKEFPKSCARILCVHKEKQCVLPFLPVLDSISRLLTKRLCVLFSALHFVLSTKDFTKTALNECSCL